MSPHPPDSGLKAFYEAKAATYRDMRSTPSLRDEAVLRLMGTRPTLRICDVGCGSGRFLRCVRALGHECFGVDISEAAVASVRSSGINAMVTDPSGGMPDFLNGRFDVVSVLDVLEHVPDPGPFLTRIGRLAAPGGCILASVPNAGTPPVRLVLMSRLIPRRPSGVFDAGHLHWFTRTSLTRLANERGWEPAAWDATPLPGCSRAGLWRIAGLQQSVFALLAARWPRTWGYQLITRLQRRPAP